MRPITLFFLGNLIYFLFPVLDTFNTLLQYQMTMPYTDIANIPGRVEQAIAESGLDKDTFYLAYNTATSSHSKLLLILLVPLVLPLVILVGWWRRKRVAEHLMFALELTIFILYVTTIMLGYLMLLVQIGVSLAGLPVIPFTDAHLTSVALVLITYFLIRGIKQFYQYSWPVSILLAFIVISLFYLPLSGYRWLLFEVTMAGM